MHTNLAAAYVDDARDRTEPFTMPAAGEAVDTLLMVRREFDDTPSADRALDAIAEAFAAAELPYTQGKFCDAIPGLSYFAALDPSSAGAAVGTANTDRANALYRCGLQQLKAGDSAEAAGNLDAFVHAYPRHRGAPQAKSALITARVADAANRRLAVPPPLGGNTPGPWPVTIYNDSNLATRVLIAGPTAHEISLPSCATCPIEYPPKSKAACDALGGLPSVTLRLEPGTYHFTTVDYAKPLTDKFEVLSGTEFSLCTYTERG